jgi:hypothetical protein
LPFFQLQRHHPHASSQDLHPFKMDKRKFLFVSLCALIGDMAWQVLMEGHDVRYYIEAEKERDIADGFVPKSKDWEKVGFRILTSATAGPKTATSSTTSVMYVK